MQLVIRAIYSQVVNFIDVALSSDSETITSVSDATEQGVMQPD